MRQASAFGLRRPIIIHLLKEALLEELEVEVAEVSIALLRGPQTVDGEALTKWRKEYWSHCSYLKRLQVGPRVVQWPAIQLSAKMALSSA